MKLSFLGGLLLLTSLAWAQTPVRLALNWKPEPQFGGFYATQVSGFDKRNGLALTLTEGGSGTPTVQMLANGQVDFAIVSAEEILISNQRNSKNPVVAVFAVFQTNPQMIMCHAEKGFKSLAEVMAAPVTLAWQGGLTYAQYLRKKYPSLKARLVPYSGGISAFLADPGFCSQGFLTSEPLAAEKAGAKVSTFLVADEGFNPYTTVLSVRAETLRAQPALVAKVVKAVSEGWRSYLRDPGPANQAMHKLNPAMDLETFAKSAKAQQPLIETDLGRMKAARWKALADTLKELQVIGPAVDPAQAFR